MTSGSTNLDFNDWHQEVIFLAWIIDAPKIQANTKLTIILSHWYNV